MRAEVGAAEVAGVDAIEVDGSTRDLVEAHDEVDQGGLTGTGGTDDRHRMSGFGGEGHLFDERRLRSVAEAHFGEFDLSRGAWGQLLVHLVGFLLLGVEQLEGPLRRGDAGLEHVRDTGHLGDRLRELT